MASTSRTLATGRTTLLLLAIATVAMGQAAVVPVGCYTSSTPLKNQGTWRYQSSGYCSGVCSDQGLPVYALTQGDLCYCGEMLPSNSDKTSSSSCGTPCNGYPDEMCGGDSTFTVGLSGVDQNVPVYGGGSSSGSEASSIAPAATSAPSTTRKQNQQQTTITSVAQGTTVVVVTQNVPAASSTADNSSSSSSGGSTNVAAIAAGVVVGVLAVTAIIAGVYFFLRHRRKQAAEEEYKRTQVSDFMRGGERKPPGTGYSQMSDSRLDPESGARRDSQGSIADNQDYSRRILRVANPDRS